MTTQNEIRKVCDVSSRLITLDADTTLNQHTHEGRTLLLSTASNITITMPAAIGSGARYHFKIGLVRGDAAAYVINVTAGTSTLDGNVFVNGDTANNATEGFTPVTATDNIITINGTTTGGLSIGDWIELEDIKSAVWAVSGMLSASGTEATPFGT